MNYKFQYQFVDNQKPQNPVLFLHGFWSSYAIFNSFARRIKTHDYYGLNLPGHGTTNFFNSSLQINELVDALIIFIKEKKLTNLTVIAHSMSGAVVQLAANKHPEFFKKIIYVSPLNPVSQKKLKFYEPFFFPNDLNDYLTLIKLIYGNAGELMKDEKYYQGLKRAYLNPDPKTPLMQDLYASFLDEKFAQNLSDAIKNNIVPSVVIFARFDGFMDQDACVKYYQSNSQNYEIIRVDHVGHVYFWEDFEGFFELFTKLDNLEN